LRSLPVLAGMDFRRRRLDMKFGTLLVLLAALSLGGIAAYGAYAIVASRPVDAPASAIVVASVPMDYGTMLSSDNIKEVSWGSSSVPEGAFRSKDELLKDGARVVLTAIEKHEPILGLRITGPNQPASLAALVDKGMRAVSIRVDEVRGVAGFVRAGDRVDVVLTRTDMKKDKGSYADILLQDVKILATGQQSREKQDKATVVKTVTVEVTAQQAQKLILADGVGTLSLVLRQTGENVPEATQRISVADLGQGEVVGSPDPAVSVVAPQPRKQAEVWIYRGAKLSTIDPNVYREGR
jgi:pilus assembly protein CpaB